MTKKGIFQVLVIVVVIVIISLSQCFAASTSHKDLIENRKGLLQQVISRINDLIAERERLTGQLILLQQLDAQAIAEKEAEAKKVIIAAEAKAKEEVKIIKPGQVLEDIKEITARLKELSGREEVVEETKEKE